ncbi:hypothetical protein [Paraburkholderia sp. CNPSo 3281]|uniref:hypothetical protein n=1 Tax=Paraburkholderia sp. CNPSo 3281 TaxID=2940933 RepID=UPI0020B72ED5|nr:hypothetical protein [Paraburkholderia sp. CNPSo 3281]MCP3715395.1 hypothetical protein [Paraburkholderia sp. CNPSo 3281]
MYFLTSRNYALKSYSYRGSGLCFNVIFCVDGGYVRLLFVNINQQTNKQKLEKPFLSKPKRVDRDGFCEDQDAFCDAVRRNWVWMGGNCENTVRFLGARSKIRGGFCAGEGHDIGDGFCVDRRCLADRVPASSRKNEWKT